jgi:hypothetical protein
VRSAGRSALTLAERYAGIRLRYITPCLPEQNGQIEWSRRIDQEDFFTDQML